jgi:hypothetical protein
MRYTRTALAATTVLLALSGLGLNTTAHAADNDDPDVWVQSNNYPVPKGATVGFPGIDCPSNAPYLRNKDYGRGLWALQPGVELVYQGSTKGIHSGPNANWANYKDGYVSGYRDNSGRIQNLDAGDQTFSVVLHCTSVRSQGYTSPNSSLG